MSDIIRNLGNYLERKRRFNNLRFIYNSCDCGYSTNSRCGGSVKPNSDCGYSTNSRCGGPVRTSQGCGYNRNSRC